MMFAGNKGWGGGKNLQYIVKQNFALIKKWPKSCGLVNCRPNCLCMTEFLEWEMRMQSSGHSERKNC